MVASDFNTLVQLGAALHLAYALLEDVHNRALSGYAEAVEDVKQQLKDERLWGHFFQQFGFIKMMMPVWQEGTQKMMKTFIKLAAIVAIADSCFLITAAFRPSLCIPLWGGFAIVALLFLPMPSFLFITYVRTKLFLAKLTPLTEAAKKAIDTPPGSE